MLSLTLGKSDRFCDGVSRRNFMRLGALGIGGLTMADLLRAEARAGGGSSNKAIINIHMAGGPSHQDTFDLKPDSPAEFRGEFSPIRTNVPGLDICEHFPKLAQMGDKFAVIRSLTGMISDHSDFHTQTGYGRKDLSNVGGRPSIGSVVAKLLGPAGTGAPPFIGYNGSYPGYLGPIYKPYSPRGGDLRLSGALTAERLNSRTQLLADLDQIRRDVDNSGQMEALDAYTQTAVDVVTSAKVADALDLNKADAKTRQRYGARDGDSFLRAFRLVQTGVRAVTFNWGSWDTHGNNFGHLKKQLPKLDLAMSALLQDLHDHGMADDVSVVMWGEFGRTPRINPGAGRDHWLALATCFLAGGGMRTGQAVGQSTKNAENVKDRPVHLQEVFATLYHCLGIDVAKTMLADPNGRPQYLLDRRQPIRELV